MRRQRMTDSSEKAPEEKKKKKDKPQKDERIYINMDTIKGMERHMRLHRTDLVTHGITSIDLLADDLLYRKLWQSLLRYKKPGYLPPETETAPPRKDPHITLHPQIREAVEQHWKLNQTDLRAIGIDGIGPLVEYLLYDRLKYVMPRYEGPKP